MKRLLNLIPTLSEDALKRWIIIMFLYRVKLTCLSSETADSLIHSGIVFFTVCAFNFPRPRFTAALFDDLRNYFIYVFNCFIYIFNDQRASVHLMKDIK